MNWGYQHRWNSSEICQKKKKRREDGEQNPRNKTVDNICLLTVAANLSTPESVWNFHCLFPILEAIAFCFVLG